MYYIIILLYTYLIDSEHCLNVNIVSRCQMCLEWEGGGWGSRIMIGLQWSISAGLRTQVSSVLCRRPTRVQYHHGSPVPQVNICIYILIADGGTFPTFPAHHICNCKYTCQRVLCLLTWRHQQRVASNCFGKLWLWGRNRPDSANVYGPFGDRKK